MSTNNDEKLVGSELKAVVPLVFFACGWSCRDQPKTAYWESPHRIRTLGDSRYGVPYGPDRWILLYLAAMGATYGQVFRSSLQQIIEMFELPWSHSMTMARLQRVLTCSMEPIIQGLEMASRHGFADRFRLFDDGTFEIALTAAFMAELEQAAPYSFEHVRQMGRSYATLDLYLWQKWALHRGRKELDKPQRFLWLARTPYKRYQQLRERCDRIREIWPECPFYWCTTRQLLAYRERRRAMRRGSVQPAQSLSHGEQPEDIQRTIDKRAAELAPSGRPQGMVPVPPSQWVPKGRPEEDAIAASNARIEAYWERIDRIAAKLDRDPFTPIAEVFDGARAATRTPASQQKRAVLRRRDHKVTPSSRNGETATDLHQSVLARLELYRQAYAEERKDDTAQDSTPTTETLTPPATPRTTEELITATAAATGQPGHQGATDVYSQLIHLFKESEKSRLRAVQLAAMVTSQQMAKPPTQTDPARSQGRLPRPEPAPAGRPAQKTASSSFMDFSTWMDADTANPVSQLIEGAKSLYKSVLSYWTQQPADPSQPDQPDDSAQPPSDGSPDPPE